MSIDRPSVNSLQIAREARERFVRATENLVAPVTRAIHERLITLTGESGTARDMQDRRDDFLAFQSQGETWADGTRAAWRQALAASGVATPSNSLLRLELIGDDVVETQILSSRLAQAIQGKANFDFSDLRLRIQHLEGTSELDSRDVLRPETLAKVWASNGWRPDSAAPCGRSCRTPSSARCWTRSPAPIAMSMSSWSSRASCPRST